MTRPQLLLALLLLACCSCTGFRGNLVPQLDRKEITPENRMPAITYQVNPSAGPNTIPSVVGWPGASSEWLFHSAFVDARPALPGEGLHIDLFFQTEMRQPSFTIGLGLITICTLGIIPTYGREDLALRARVEYQGKLGREYTYNDQMDLWIHLFLIPWSFSQDPVAIEREIYENLLLHFLRDLRKDLPQIAPELVTGAPAPPAN